MAGYVRKEYEESDAVRQLQQALQNQNSTKPGAYVSQNQGQMNALRDTIQNRKPFQYDVTGDALYQQYKDQYIRQGQKAMMDTMGQAAAMTGGYGNSYAQMVGQQTYGEYLQGLQSRIPELYGLAMNRYQMEGNQLLDQYNLLYQQENQDYSRYRDLLNDWSSETERLYQQYIQERNYDYGRYTDEQDFAYAQYRDGVTDDHWNQSFQYQQGQDQLAYDRWLQEFNYQKQQDELAYQQWQQEFQEDQRRWNASQTSTSSRGSGGSSSKKQSKTEPSKAETFVDNMLKNATSSQFNPQRVINGTSALTSAEKEEAQAYLKKLQAQNKK